MPKLQIPPPNKPSRPPKTALGKKVLSIMSNVSEAIHLIGPKIMGEQFWKIFYLSIQDIIALALLSQVSEWIYPIILGYSINSLAECLVMDSLSPGKYACFIIVASDFCGWILIAGRLIGRFFADITDINSRG